MRIEIEVFSIAYHRNGVCGEPFHAIVFTDNADEGGKKLAIVFEMKCHVAVLDISKLVEFDVRFGSNSWRGDCFEPALRDAIAHYRNRQA